MHYALSMKMKIKELQEKNERMAKAIWKAKSQVKGGEMGVSPFDEVIGNESFSPVTDPQQLREIILNLPL